jgi:hypothetical protein
VASFGVDALRRVVQLRPGSLAGPGRARPENVFGEQTAAARTAAAPLTVADDRLGLFEGEGPIGQFTVFERSRALGPGARILTSAGRVPGERDLVAYRLSRGAVIRAGTPQWAAQLASSPTVADATIRLWRFLRRG